MSGAVKGTLKDGIEKPFELLERWGVLLLQDPRLPNLVSLVAGERVRGSWWGHSRGHAIFQMASKLEDHPDITMTKLISGKVTFVHRRLWPQLIAVGRSRERWQMDGLTQDALRLLARVDEVKQLQASGRAAKLLATRLLVAGREVHTDSGAHATELAAWEAFARLAMMRLPRMSAERAQDEFEEIVSAMNTEFDAAGRLPWKKRP